MRTLALWAAASLLTLGSTNAAQAQTLTNEMWLRANALATRMRVDREIRQAREKGAIKRWSPAAIDLPWRPRAAAYANELAVPPQAEPDAQYLEARSAP